MKLIIAYVRPEVLQGVKHNLFVREIYSMSVTNVMGAGRQKGYTEMYRGIQTEVNLLKKLRLEIGVQDNQVETAITAICDGAKTDQAGDGVIFVMDMIEARRIRTGESM